MPALVRIEGAKVLIGSRVFPLERVEEVSAEELRPRVERWLIALGAAVLCIPALNRLDLENERYALASYFLVAVVFLAAIFRIVFGDVTYALVLGVAGVRRIALKSPDHRLIISVMADVQDILQSRPGRAR